MPKAVAIDGDIRLSETESSRAASQSEVSVHDPSLREARAAMRASQLCKKHGRQDCREEECRNNESREE